MALWRPYAQSDEPQDLGKSALKSDEVSPRPSFGSPKLPPPVQGGYYAMYPDPQHLHGYFYQPALPYVPPAVAYVVPASSSAASTISPDSTGSWSLTQPKPPSLTALHDSDTESLNGDMEYEVFERDAFKGLAEKNGGSLLGSNPKMKRAVQTSQSNNAYRQQRARNNLAAKQSRDRRKLREIRLACQVSFLKKKMAALKSRMAAGVCVQCAGQM